MDNYIWRWDANGVAAAIRNIPRGVPTP